MACCHPSQIGALWRHSSRSCADNKLSHPGAHPRGGLFPNSGKASLRHFHRSLPRVRVIRDSAETSNAVQDDYYSLLGVPPSADVSKIKKAYRELMREYHPDMSADEDSTEFAIFLNEVYETLLDPDSRAAYDAIAGFTPDALNPFLDASAERDMVFVDEFTCIGCRNCNNVCSRTFEMEDEYGRARVMRQGVDTDDKLQEAIDTCPVSCIHWVSAAQLALLEDTMARMERVSAWLLMSNGGGKAGNTSVFSEASLAWEKRQMQNRARMEAAKWSMWTPATGAWAQQRYSQQASADSGDSSSDPDAPNNGNGNGNGRVGGRRASAASVAAAARKWRDFQRRRRNREQKFLEVSTSSSTSMDA